MKKLCMRPKDCLNAVFFAITNLISISKPLYKRQNAIALFV